jgi:RNA polymerase sigma-70 factor (ECF subfamily)
MPRDDNEGIQINTWEAWLQANGAKLLLFARQQTRTQSDAEDVLQNALIKSWKTTQSTIDPATIGLAFTNIRRCAIDLARVNTRRHHREEISLRTNGEPVSWFDSALEQQERAREIQIALEQLSPDFREVVTLKIWGDLTFAQISNVLEISPNTAASRYRYALQALRKSLHPIPTPSPNSELNPLDAVRRGLRTHLLPPPHSTLTPDT